MNKVSLSGLPARRAADYELNELSPVRYARVIYTPQESKPDRVMIEAQAFEIDSFGNFVASPNGMPSRTPGTVHVISLTGLGDTHCLVPSFVRVVGDYNAETLPAGATVASQLPSTANPGDLVYVEPTLYKWKEGMIEQVMQGKATELAGLIRNSAATINFEL